MQSHRPIITVTLLTYLVVIINQPNDISAFQRNDFGCRTLRKKLSLQNKVTMKMSSNGKGKPIVFSQDLEKYVEVQNTSNKWVDLSVSKDELRPSATLTNGQCFNWIPVESLAPNDYIVNYVESKSTSPNKSAWGIHDAKEWIGCINESVFQIKETDSSTLFKILAGDINVNEAKYILHDYFQLDISLKKLYKSWSKDDNNRMARIATAIPGCRIIRQDPSQCLFSFICSSNNNIPRITQILSRFSEKYGNPIVDVPCRYIVDGEFERDSFKLHSFPKLHSFEDATEDDFRDLGFGYRAKYMVKTRDLLMERGGEDFLFSLREKSEDYVQDELIQFHGIGRKVADCVALFSLDQTSAIPVDVHVQHIACRDYNSTFIDSQRSLTPRVYKEIGDIFRERFSAYPGWAHSLLFVAELPSFRDALPEDILHEMEEWRVKESEMKAERKIKKNKKLLKEDSFKTPSPKRRKKMKQNRP